MATSSATAVRERSPPESSESRLIFLPAGRASTSMPVVSMSAGSVRTSRPSPPGNSRAKTRTNWPGGVLERLGEDLLDAVVDFLDDVQQVLAAGLQVLELGAEELVALLQRGELLQRQRVDLAQGREVAFGAFEPFFLFRTDEGLALGDLASVLVHRGAQGGPFVRRFRRQGPGRAGPVRSRPRAAPAVSPSSSTLFEFQRLDPQPLLRAGELVAVHGVGQFGQFAGQGVVAAADPGQFAVHRRPCVPRRCPARGGPVPRTRR